MTNDLPDISPGRGPTWRKGVVFLSLAGLAGVLLSLGAMALRPAKGPEVASELPPPLPVSVMAVNLQDTAEIEDLYTGIAEARRSSMLGFQTPGRIAQVGVRIADQVRQGQLLARLDTRGLSAQLDAARAQVEEARAAWQLALDTATRQEVLRARGHVSQQRVDEALAQADTAMARLQSAEALAGALEVQIDLASIRAPFDGVITRRLADEGAIAGPGQPVLELVESGHLEARIGLPARTAAALQPGQAYRLEAETGTVDAVLRSVTGVVDPALRTVTAVFEISPQQAAEASLPAGAVLRLRMSRPIGEPGFWVPVRALSSASRGLWSVYVAVPVEGGFTSQNRLVEIVIPGGEDAYVRGPVTAGEMIITDGLHRVTPGMRVSPREAGRTAAGTGG